MVDAYLVHSSFNSLNATGNHFSLVRRWCAHTTLTDDHDTTTLVVTSSSLLDSRSHSSNLDTDAHRRSHACCHTCNDCRASLPRCTRTLIPSSTDTNDLDVPLQPPPPLPLLYARHGAVSRHIRCFYQPHSLLLGGGANWTGNDGGEPSSRC